jgi:hypothetical protein
MQKNSEPIVGSGCAMNVLLMRATLATTHMATQTSGARYGRRRSGWVRLRRSSANAVNK